MKRLAIFFGVMAVAFGCVIVNAATPANLYKKVGGNPQGYIFESSSTGFVFASPSETSRREEVKFSDLKGEGLKIGVLLTDRDNVLAEARAAFSSGDYRKAAADFRKVVDEYAYLINIPNNFASEAKFYEIECYKRAGAYKSVTAELESPAGKTIAFRLGAHYQKAIKMQKLWAIFGSGDVDKIEQAISIYQKPVVGSESMLPSPSFQEMPPSDLAQVAYIRGKLYEKKGEKQHALRDYYRVFTLGQHNTILSKQAMASALKIQSEDPRLKSANEKVKTAAIRQMQSLAFNYTKRFPGTSLPLELQSYGKSPRIDIVLPTIAAGVAKNANKENVTKKAPVKKAEPVNKKSRGKK